MIQQLSLKKSAGNLGFTCAKVKTIKSFAADPAVAPKKYFDAFLRIKIGRPTLRLRPKYFHP